ncbi:MULTISPECIES: ABC transporter permease [unclassified Janthinobacterium]|uniref:PhnE/PtxC family ABC transporter permease n=1 Tax=unclassified Janthinobacterium TaxID=2610881 RepID=UPI001614AD90|nr:MULTISPECIES: ABC transporter permease [unclassified Janthinobacterium]MBB5606295.1 phosphonate transport system permease protein [Janthinobacterium sp. S3T4]MBB5611833.1 phosphonate transport system permease protein [Janthinobacterium sp. S3M3]
MPRDPAWRGRLITTAVVLIVLWPMLVQAEFKPWILWDAQSLSATWQFLSSFAPPAHSAEFLAIVATSTWETIAMATAGMALAMLGAIPLTLLVTERLSISRLGSGKVAPWSAALRHAVRTLLVVLRSVPELVWALLLVRIVGLGPTAGVIAIALTYCGMLGKVYAEILESSDASACNALLNNGSSRLAALLYGALPDAAAELVSYTIYRWECAIRGSVVMGFVGAGGLGQRMDESMKMMAGDELATMLMVFVVLVAGADAVSAMLRRRLS